MVHPKFETPHPSIHTHDQTFKLPSSQPRYSPNLSPVPISTTKSRNLKENRVSTPWAYKTLTSGGRSASVSSSNSSSSRKSKEHQMRTKKSLKANMKPKYSKPRSLKSGIGSEINLARALASPFVSRASSPIDDQGSNINPSGLPHPKSRPNSRSSDISLGKRGLSDTFYNPNLPSRDRTHTTDGLQKGKIYHAHSAHTSPSSKVPSSILLDLNTQLNQKRRRGHRGTVSVDGIGGAVPGYPEDLGGGGAKTKKKYQRERRPSAPSSYSRRLRPPALPLLVGVPVGLEDTKTRRLRLASGLEIIHNNNGAGALTTVGISTAGSANHIDDDSFVQPLLPHPHEKKNNPISAAPDTGMDWRVGIVDFDRPPSQMCHYPTTTLLSGWVGEDIFSSGSEGPSSESESEGEDSDDKGMEGTKNMINPTHASRMRTRTACPLTSGPMSMFDDPFGFGSVLPPDLNLTLAATLNLDLDLDQSMFGDGARGISTPLKTQLQAREKKERKERREKRMMLKATSTSDLRSKIGGLVRMRSLPVMGGVGRRAMVLDDYDQENHANEGEDDKEERDSCEQDQQEERDMDLTTPLITATVDMDAVSATLKSPEVQLVDKRGDMAPWILDSLISPPSRFLKTQGEIEQGGHPRFEDWDGESVEDQDGEILFSKTLSSSSSELSLSSPFRLTSDAHSDAHIHIQSQHEALPSATSATAAATATTSFTAKRTRSGTIVPFSRLSNISNISNNTSININTNDPPGTRRTRSGTLVGPLPLPLAASGSGVQLAVGNGNLSVRKGRERSGTILASPSWPLPTGVGGAKRSRSGTVIGCAPPVSAPAFVSVSVPGRKSSKETGPGPEILEEDLSTTSNSKSGTMDRSDEHRSGFDHDENLDGFTNADVEVDMDGFVDVEPHIDALYVPRQSSSPDPIDFLRLAHFQDYIGMRDKRRFGSGLTKEGRKDEDPDFGGGGGDNGIEEMMEGEMVWCIADEPPSPIVRRNESKLGMMRRKYNKGGILSVGHGGVRGNGNNRGRREKETGSAKGRGKTTTRTRFMIDGHEERPDEIVVEPEEGEGSDDELLLGDGSTLDI